jgi:hypothetical protein
MDNPYPLTVLVHSTALMRSSPGQLLIVKHGQRIRVETELRQSYSSCPEGM